MSETKLHALLKGKATNLSWVATFLKNRREKGEKIFLNLKGGKREKRN